MRKNERRRLTPLAHHRRAAGMSQTELARRLRVKQSTVHGWESGKFRPEPERVKRLAEELRLEPLRVEELLDEPGHDAR